MSFHVGQLVECVDAGPSHKGIASNLVKGSRYTIARFEGVDAWGEEGYLVAEAEPTRVRGHRYGFRGSRFRAAAESKTDISALKRIARDITERKPDKITERT